MSVIVFLGLLLALGYLSPSLRHCSAVLLGAALFAWLTSLLPTLFVWLSGAGFVLAGLLSLTPLRIGLISGPVFRWFREVAPRLSATERQALEAGTTWWDAELFSGEPRWQKLLSAPEPKLRDDELAFLIGPVVQLCDMLDEWQVSQQGDLPDSVWTFLKQEKFFSLIIEKQYGGLEFSAAGNSAVVARIASRSLTAAITVMVPNSLGPGELLRDFGTEEQKSNFLPKLADGSHIPCFALTGIGSGSDAAAMSDTGVVCYGDWEGEQVLGLRLNWNKRYITLAPVATLIGVAFLAKDPDGLLGGEEELGISCALIPANLKGVWHGHRHYPVGSVFMNGPLRGEDVFVPLDYVIGGAERLGQGWQMLMHCLAAGRAISLPALGATGIKLSALYSGQYARVRRQFGLPIGYFEGIEEVLARLAAEAYRVEAARRLTLSALALGEKPGVLSAILKFYTTEANRRSVNDAMDIHAGKGIITGPSNYLAPLYQALPIGITVEGANILTRSLIVFGQGAVRNHPWLQSEIRLAGQESSPETLAEYDRVLFSHLGFVLRNGVRSFIYGLTGARWIASPVEGRTAHYYRQLTRLSTVFAFVADVLLLSLGSRFKVREKLSGRMADVLTHLYLASAVLKFYRDSGSRKEEHPLVHFALRDSLFQIQNALVNTLRNLPHPWLGTLVRCLIFPLGRPYREPSDRLGRYAARILLANSDVHERLFSEVVAGDGSDAPAQLKKAFDAIQKTQAIEKVVSKSLGEVLTVANFDVLISEAERQEIIGHDDAEQLKSCYRMIAAVLQVNDFPDKN